MLPRQQGDDMAQKIIIDTDPGQDDAVAILLALASPELEVLGITAVAGNVPLPLTLRNARATGEFVWNLATRALAEQMNASAATVPGEVDEFTLAGLAVAPSNKIAAPRVALSPASFECVLTQLIRLETRDGAAVDTWLVIGEVVGIHIDRAMLEDGVYQTARAHPILRGGGPADYFEITEAAKFAMKRPG